MIAAAGWAWIGGAHPHQIQDPARRGPLAAGVVAITNVTVVPMTRDTLVANATVVVRDGRIVSVGPAGRATVPADARVIDGRGRYLIPGLADMHVHLFSDGADVPDSIGAAELGAMLASGVTAARLMIGQPRHQALRDDVAAGRVPGPQLWIAGPQVTGDQGDDSFVATTPAEARSAVQRTAEAGYDFVKLTNNIVPEVYDAVVGEARKRGIPVVGHVDPRVGVARALAAGQQLEHLDGFLEDVLADSAPSRVSVTQYGLFTPRNWISLDHVDDAKVDRLARAAAVAGVFIGPTQNVFHVFAVKESDSSLRARPDWDMWPTARRDGYLRARERYWSAAAAEFRTDARRARYVEVRNRIVKRFHEAGGRLLAGSDTPEWFHTYGWGLHRELQALVAAGLSPFDALAAATRNPAEFLRVTNAWGTVEPGKRADLVLLSANPLSDIANTMRIDGVMMGGRWYTRPELDDLVARARRGLAGDRR